MDTPRVWVKAGDKRAPRCFRGKPSCHLISDLEGDAGTFELFSFAISIGMKTEWLQHSGTDREHFNLVGKRIIAARRAGALVDDDLFRAVLRRRMRTTTRPVEAPI